MRRQSSIGPLARQASPERDLSRLFPDFTLTPPARLLTPPGTVPARFMPPAALPGFCRRRRRCRHVLLSPSSSSSSKCAWVLLLRAELAVAPMLVVAMPVCLAAVQYFVAGGIYRYR